jgi:zinc transporter ZupT
MIMKLLLSLVLHVFLFLTTVVFILYIYLVSQKQKTLNIGLAFFGDHLIYIHLWLPTLFSQKKTETETEKKDQLNAIHLW